MIIMTDKLKEMMDELKITNSETFYHGIHVKGLVYKMLKLTNQDGFTDFSKDEIDYILKGALMHDIGKLFVKNVILTKMSRLTDEEKTDMKMHTKLGFESIESELKTDEYEIIKNIILYHHERIDGSGYDGKTDLPIYVQIVSVCDVFDALKSDRIYREGLPYETVMDIIENGKSGGFAEELVDYLKKITCGMED